jgi:hypothetical protein
MLVATHVDLVEPLWNQIVHMYIFKDSGISIQCVVSVLGCTYSDSSNYCAASMLEEAPLKMKRSRAMLSIGMPDKAFRVSLYPASCYYRA